MPAPDFKEIANRDAWSTIRGFVYQVDHTILRWINLQASEALELERGEDIDQIGTDIQNLDTRTLEQLKYRGSKVSLNQQLTLDIMRNFYLHRNNNPALNLKFRFITNAGYTLERPAIFIDARKGIDVWMELAKLDSIDPTNEDLQIIKKYLSKKIVENITTDEQAEAVIKADSLLWEEFGNYLENDDQLISFVQEFEWSVQNADHRQITKDIISKLDELYPGKPGKLIYERLFLFVFKLLCSPGIKRLNTNELIVQTGLPELGATDKHLFDILNTVLGDLQAKLTTLENGLVNNSTQIDQLYQAVDLLKSDTTFEFRLNDLSIDPPNLINNGTSRKEKAQEILDLFQLFDWVAFQGINGTGKTQLASLVCREFARVFWLDLREMASDAFRAPLVIETFLANLTNQPLLPDRTLWLRKVVNSFPENSVIILNDLPEISNDTPGLLHLMVSIGLFLKDSNVKILTTSNHKLPVTLRSAASIKSIEEYYDFNFSDDEINECLTNNGADQSVLKYTSLIAARSHRNPRLVLAIIYHLKSLNWGEGQSSLSTIAFGSDFSADVIADAQRSISRYIRDEKTRELLYRLSLISWDFGIKEVQAISEVPERITFPNEHLSTLSNVWIQQLNKLQYQVSPIISNIGANNLSKTVVQQVHAAFADELISGKKINQKTAIRAILSYVQGAQFDSAGNLLFNFYRSAVKKEEVQLLDQWGYLRYWTDVPLPEEMELSLRVFIKVEQLRLNKLLDRDTEVFFSTIHNFLKLPDFPENEGIVVRILLLSQYPELPLNLYWEYLRFVLERWPEFCYKEDLGIDMPLFSGLLWIPLTTIFSENDIRHWLELVDLFTSNFKEDLFANEVASAAMGIICRNIATLNPDELEITTLVKSRLGRLQILSDHFHRLNQDTLEVLATREMINIRLVSSDDIEQTKHEILRKLDEFQGQVPKFLLTAYLGRTLLRNGKLEEARSWLDKALLFDCKKQIEYVEALSNAASSYIKTDPQKSIDFCLEAVQISKSREPFVPVEYMQALAELGLAYWLSDNFRQTFNTYEVLVNELFDTKVTSFNKEWIRIFSLTGHTTGYMSSMIKTGVPPQKDGSDYFTPYLGMFTLDNRDLSEFYKPNNDALVAAQMAFFADGLNNPEKSYEWSLKAFDMARKAKNQASILMIASTCSQYAVIKFKPEEALESYLLFAAVSAHLAGDNQTKYNGLSTVDLKELLRIRPSDKWATAEKTTVTMAILPLFIKVLEAYLDNTDYKDDWKDSYLYVIEDYIPDASDKLLWDLVLEISSKILDNRINVAQLMHRANTFGDQDRKELQILCMIGVAFLTRENTEIAGILLNMIPYLQKLYGATGSINKFVLLPFVKNRSIHIIKEDFVGSKTDLQTILNKIDNIDVVDPHAIQKVLRPAVDLLYISTLEDRKQWLYHFEEI
ncbi:hypothetical protein AB6735_22200 [Mucilaginibacter sp. RCC_168]|uniref:hypothetical protein n=1 Tax=Mucilaginibacter sp. RCC_168 TaxID=3239221 RepID=UPI0035243807